MAITAGKAYYGRGAGPVRLTGPADYSAFSKVMLGDERHFGLTPEKLVGYGRPWGTWHGQAFGAMPVAVALWRYVTPAADWLPSVHEVASGMHVFTADEKKYGLGGHRGDFCTVVSLVRAMQALAVGGLAYTGYPTPNVTGQGKLRDLKGSVSAAVKVWETPGISDKTIGTAWRLIHQRLGAKIPAPVSTSGATVAPYDYSCRFLATS